MTDLTDLVNLASERLGARAVEANDDFFAGKENLVKDAEAIANGEYTDRGKWMDGWETRRRREPGHDWCVVRLGARGIVRQLVIDTTHFKGNHPPECSVEALDSAAAPADLRQAAWRPLLQRCPLRADSKNKFALPSPVPATHIRLCIYPDGGVARLRALGEVVPDLESLSQEAEVNLAAIQYGAVVVLVSDMFFGDRQNLIMPGRGQSMRDGWETRRRRDAGNDWAIVRLIGPGTVHRIEVDTAHFKGNAPGSCSIEGIFAPDAAPAELQTSGGWKPVVARRPLTPHANHVLESDVQPAGVLTHVRLNIFPDGGVSRLLVWGRLT
ncbi:MAG TPA: allantoicase [Gemmatimonadaceae bacterium]|nr:allantoicase [Gemmatimonadaceae bacterium]